MPILLNRSRCYSKLNTAEYIEEARKDIQAAISKKPNFWRSYYQLAEIEIQTRNWKKAKCELVKALELNPESVETVETLRYVESTIGNEVKICIMIKEFILAKSLSF